jgi:hypothetical protein
MDLGGVVNFFPDGACGSGLKKLSETGTGVGIAPAWSFDLKLRKEFEGGIESAHDDLLLRMGNERVLAALSGLYGL